MKLVCEERKSKHAHELPVNDKKTARKSGTRRGRNRWIIWFQKPSNRKTEPNGKENKKLRPEKEKSIIFLEKLKSISMNEQNKKKKRVLHYWQLRYGTRRHLINKQDTLAFPHQPNSASERKRETLPGFSSSSSFFSSIKHKSLNKRYEFVL